MKLLLLVALILCALTGASASSRETPRALAFNLGDQALITELSPAGTGSFALPGSDARGIITATDGIVEIAIPTRVAAYRGSYVRIPGCDAFVASAWQDKAQSQGLRRTNAELRWLGCHPKRQVLQSPEFTIYFAQDAKDLLESWKMRYDYTNNRIWIAEDFSVNPRDSGKELNRAMLVEKRNNRLYLTAVRVNGDEVRFALKRSGEYSLLE